MGLFQTRLGSVATAGLNIPNIQAEYICHYKGGLIGKHFKTLAQVMSFLIFDLVPRNVLQAWLVIGRLMVLAWCTDIEDIDAYTVRESLLLKACSNDDTTPERAFNMHSRLSPCHMQVQPKYPHFEAEISLPCPFANVHPMFWTSSTFFNRTL